MYSGYAPLTVRLAQLLSRPGWRSIEEVLRILPGPHFEERQLLPTGLQKKRKSTTCASIPVGGGSPGSAQEVGFCSARSIQPGLLPAEWEVTLRYFALGQPGENRVTLVFFLGGVTFAEIAALRFLSQLEDGGTEYVIATTKLMNGATWIQSLMESPRVSE